MTTSKHFILFWVLNVGMLLFNSASSINNLFIHPAPLWLIAINAIGVGFGTFGIAGCIRMTLLRREIRHLDQMLELLRER